MAKILEFKLPENAETRHFDKLMQREIDRMKALKKPAPPELKEPILLKDYTKFVHDEGLFPTKEQFQRFFDAFKDSSSFTKLTGVPGLQLIPALMPYSHEMESFSAERIEKFGHLVLYTITPESLTAGLHNPIYLNAVLPLDFFRKNPILPETFSSPKDFEEFNKAVMRSLLRLLRLTA